MSQRNKISGLVVKGFFGGFGGEGLVFLYNNPGCTGTHSVDQAGLNLAEIYLLLSPECWAERHALPLPGLKHFL